MVYILKITSIRRPALMCDVRLKFVHIRNTNVCKFVIFAAIDILKNATDTILILCRDSQSPMLLSKYNTEKKIIKSLIGCRVSNTN